MASRPVERSTGRSADVAGREQRAGWSKARLSAAVAVNRCGRKPVPSEQPLRDEVEFFADVGTRRDVRTGAALARRGSTVREVHLVERGALAVTGEHGGRSPILAFALRGDLCCAVPVLLHESTPWDAVAVMDSSVIAVPADAFSEAVGDRWVDRWSTRTLAWLAEVGTRMADLDQPDPKAQVAALLLRFRGSHSEDLCRRAIADLLDLDDASARSVLSDFERVGAVRNVGGHLSVVRADLLRATITAASRPQRRIRSRAKIGHDAAPRPVAAAAD